MGSLEASLQFHEKCSLRFGKGDGIVTPAILLRSPSAIWLPRSSLTLCRIKRPRGVAVSEDTCVDTKTGFNGN